MRHITDITGDIYIRDLQEKISLKKKKTREDRTGWGGQNMLTSKKMRWDKKR